MNLIDIVNTLTGNFWTRRDELIDDIESLGAEDDCIAVVYATDEFLNVANYDTDEEITVYIGHTSSNKTIWIEGLRKRR